MMSGWLLVADCWFFSFSQSLLYLLLSHAAPPFKLSLPPFFSSCPSFFPLSLIPFLPCALPLSLLPRSSLLCISSFSGWQVVKWGFHADYRTAHCGDCGRSSVDALLCHFPSHCQSIQREIFTRCVYHQSHGRTHSQRCEPRRREGRNI